ncbi:MAG: hypothetical protein ACR2IQ_02015 [Minisyncoccia bacterium]
MDTTETEATKVQERKREAFSKMQTFELKRFFNEFQEVNYSGKGNKDCLENFQLISKELEKRSSM